MHIVIDIPKSLYANLAKIEHGTAAAKRILDCVKNGTPLPKGHGRLIDIDTAYDDFAQNDYDLEETIEYAPTIIKADEEGEE